MLLYGCLLWEWDAVSLMQHVNTRGSRRATNPLAQLHTPTHQKTTPVSVTRWLLSPFVFLFPLFYYLYIFSVEEARVLSRPLLRI